jgi:hypothetical protein
MAQIEVYEFLKDAVLSGDKRYFSINELSKEIGIAKRVVRRAVIKMWNYYDEQKGYLESLDGFPRRFRLNLKSRKKIAIYKKGN